MALSGEIQAAIIKVAGDWAVAMASTSRYNQETEKYEPALPSKMGDELQNDFDFAYKFLKSMSRGLARMDSLLVS